MSRKINSPNWAACKMVLKNWPQRGVVALLQEMYRLSAENQQFLHSRLLPEHSAQTLDAACKKLSGFFTDAEILRNRFRHADVKKFIDHFARGADDSAAVAALLLHDLHLGFDVLNAYGDDEQMVDHLYATLIRAHKLLETLPAETLPPLVEELSALDEAWGASFGYGISDELHGVSNFWREKVGLPPFLHDWEQRSSERENK